MESDSRVKKYLIKVEIENRKKVKEVKRKKLSQKVECDRERK